MSEFRDVYSRITNRIIADLEQGVRPWMRPWSVEHAAVKITRPLRHNAIPYKGINVVMLWSASVTKGYACPIWLTFKRALELGGNVRKGEHGELVVYANSITRTETNETGEETEREIPFLKGYTVFNAEQCEESSRAIHRDGRAPCPITSSAHRCRRPVLCRDRHRYPPRWHPRLLRRRIRPCADAALRDLPRCRELRRHAGARADPRDQHEKRLAREATETANPQRSGG